MGVWKEYYRGGAPHRVSKKLFPAASPCTAFAASGLHKFTSFHKAPDAIPRTGTPRVGVKKHTYATVLPYGCADGALPIRTSSWNDGYRPLRLGDLKPGDF